MVACKNNPPVQDAYWQLQELSSTPIHSPHPVQALDFLNRSSTINTQPSYLFVKCDDPHPPQPNLPLFVHYRASSYRILSLVAQQHGNANTSKRFRSIYAPQSSFILDLHYSQERRYKRRLFLDPLVCGIADFKLQSCSALAQAKIIFHLMRPQKASTYDIYTTLYLLHMLTTDKLYSFSHDIEDGSYCVNYFGRLNVMSIVLLSRYLYTVIFERLTVVELFRAGRSPKAEGMRGFGWFDFCGL